MVRPILLVSLWLCLAASGPSRADPPEAPPIVNAVGPAVERPTTAEPPGPAQAVRSADPAAPPAPPVPEFEQRPIGGPGPAGTAPADGAVSGWLGSTWWAMLVVIGLIFLAAWATKRWAPGPLGGRGTGPFRVLSRWHLSARQYVALVQLGQRMMLIGVTGQQMSLLAEITDPAEVEHLLASCPTGRSILSDGFGQLLGRHRREMSEAGAEGEAAGGAAERAAGQLGRLAGQVRERLVRLKSGEGRRD